MRVNVIFGNAAPLVALFLFDAITGLCWFVPNRRTIDSAGVLVMVPIMTIAFGGLMIFHVRMRRATVRLLRFGVVAYATLRDHAFSRPALHRLHFTFEHCGETYDAITQTDDVATLVDDPREQIVFSPEKVPHVVFVDALPGRPRIREDNSIDPRRHVIGGVTATVLLTAAVVVNVAGAFLWLR